jgi:hypothetical protein
MPAQGRRGRCPQHRSKKNPLHIRKLLPQLRNQTDHMQRFLQFLAVLAVSTGATYAQMTPTAQQVIKYLGQQRINQCRIDAMNRRAYEDAQRI